MRIGVPKEIKNSERRVALTPDGVKELVSRGHVVRVEFCAGNGSGFANEDYEKAGALMSTIDDVWTESQLIIKVKEPVGPEWGRIKKDHILFTYLHLAANEALTFKLLDTGATCIAYETVQRESGELPLLTPMSEVAGVLAVQKGGNYLDVAWGGVTGVVPASVVIIGGGVVGAHAARAALGCGASVTVLDLSPLRLDDLAKRLPTVQTVQANMGTLRKHLMHADLVIGAVLVHGAKAPKIFTREDLSLMRKGAVIVDVAVDQGGCFETTHPTTHADPIYEVDGIIHYCVANMPGAVPRTSTIALTRATLPYITAIADRGWKQALLDDEALRKGLNVCEGHVTHRGVADAFGMDFKDPQEFLRK